MRTTCKQVSQKRVLIAELDSMEQVRLFVGTTEADAVRSITGMLRAAILVSGRVLVTDSMVLDGLYFAHVSPESLAQLLGVADHELPITVLSSASTLSAALEGKLNDDDFEWQLRTNASLDENALHRHWERWTAAAARGAFDIEPWGAATARPLVTDGFLSEAPDAVWADGLGQAAGSLLDRSLGTARRSVFLRLWKNAIGNADEVTAAELRAVRAWWLRAYLTELATRNGADWLHFGNDDTTEPAADTSHHRSLRLSGTLLELLRDVPPPVFGTLLYVVRDRRAAFIAKPTRDRLRTLAYAVANAFEAPNRHRVLGTAIVHLIFAVAAAAVALPFLPKQLLGVDSAWTAFAVVAVATIPWRELLTLIRLATARRSAELVLVGASTTGASTTGPESDARTLPWTGAGRHG